MRELIEVLLNNKKRATLIMGCLLFRFQSICAQHRQLSQLHDYYIEIFDSFSVKRPAGVDYINGFCGVGNGKIAFYFSEPSLLHLYDLRSGRIEIDTLIFSDKIPRSANTPQLYSLRVASPRELLFIFDQSDFLFINNCFYLYDIRKKTFSTTKFNFSSTFLKYYYDDSNMHMTPMKYSFKIDDIGNNESIYRGHLFVTVKNDYKSKTITNPYSRPWIFKFSTTDTPKALNISLTDLRPELIRKTAYTSNQLLPIYYKGAQYFSQKGKIYITHAFSNRMAVVTDYNIENIMELTTNSIDANSMLLPDTNSIEDDFHKYCSFSSVFKHNNLRLRPIHFPNTDAEGRKLPWKPGQFGYLVYNNRLKEQGFIAPNQHYTIIQSLGTNLLLSRWGDNGNGSNKFYIGRIKSRGNLLQPYQYTRSSAIDQDTRNQSFLSMLNDLNDTVFVLVTNKSCAPCNMKNKELLRKLKVNPELINDKIIVTGYHSDSGYVVNNIKINHPKIIYQYDDILNDSFQNIFSVGIIYRSEDHVIHFVSIGTDQHDIIYNRLLRK
jgi:hypothetical protein